MPVTFDGTQKLIIATPGTTSLGVERDLYSTWKDWILESTNNAGFLPAFSIIGGEPIGGGISVGTTVFLINGWKIRPQESNHELVIVGNLFTDDVSSVVVPTLGNYTVSIRSQVSSLAQSISVGGNTGNQITPTQISNAVWNTPISDLTVVGTIGRMLHRIGKLFGVTSTSVTASENSRSTGDGDIQQTITTNPDGSKTMSGSP